jgi:ectoine hydroxylase-related dioxygenase (phytanoyl-CoA dioxygenase family)
MEKRRVNIGDQSMSIIRTDTTPFSAEETEAICADLRTDGYACLGPMLDSDEVAALRGAMERKHADPAMHEEEGDHIRSFSMMRMFEYDNAFRDLIAREPIVSLMEHILGPDCHLMSQNALRTEHGEGVTGWHVDDLVHFPLPDGIDRHDPRITMPVYVINVMFPVTDVESIEFGPTQVVAGSHYAGRGPYTQDEPMFEDNGPTTLLARAGDCYLFHNQVWHRGALNTSNRTRLVAGATYSRRFISQRFYPFIDYRMPEHVMDGVSPRLARLLGQHEKGAYG